MKHTKLCTILMSVLLIIVVGCSGGGADSKQSDKPKSETTTSAQSDTSREKATASTEQTTASATETKKPDVTNGDTGKGIQGPTETHDKVFALIYDLDTSIEQVSELRRLILDNEFVTDVQVFNIDDDVKNSDTQIFEGKIIPRQILVTVFL